MPKTSIDFPDHLTLDVSYEMRYALVTIGYQTGNGGRYAAPARNILERGIREYLAKLSPSERKEYDEILGNVRLRESARLEKQKSPVE